MSGQLDPEIRPTMKGNLLHFRIKIRIGVNDKLGLIRCLRQSEPLCFTGAGPSQNHYGLNLPTVIRNSLIRENIGLCS